MTKLMERLQDQNKAAMSPHFVENLQRIAQLNDTDEDTVWAKWQDYTKTCRSYDQSPVLSEFCQWNKYQELR